MRTKQSKRSADEKPLPDFDWAEIDRLVYTPIPRPRNSFTVYDYAEHSGLSRARSNEILNELLEEGVLEAMIEHSGKKVYWRKS